MTIRDQREREWFDAHADSDYHRLRILVRASYDTFGDEPSRWEITVIRGNTGATLGISIGDFDRACEIAERWFDELLPEYREQERLRTIRHDALMERMAAERAEREAREKVERAERRAAAKREKVKVEQVVCPECGHFDNQDAFDIEVRECSRCGQTLIGEDARRCPDCNIFTARVGDIACPSCEQPLDAEPEVVTGVEVAGVFVPDSEIEGGDDD